MTLHLMMNTGNTIEIPNVAYFSVYPHENNGSSPLLRVEIQTNDKIEIEYYELRDIKNIWSRV